jgi:hypothetical protein
MVQDFSLYEIDEENDLRKDKRYIIIHICYGEERLPDPEVHRQSYQGQGFEKAPLVLPDVSEAVP